MLARDVAVCKPHMYLQEAATMIISHTKPATCIMTDDDRDTGYIGCFMATKCPTLLQQRYKGACMCDINSTLSIGSYQGCCMVACSVIRLCLFCMI